MIYLSRAPKKISEIITVIFLAYAIGRVVSSLPAINSPRILADTTAYFRISRQPIQELKFWSSARPPIFPLLLKISKQDVNIATMLHLGFSIFAWGLLALMTIRFLEFTWLKLLAFCLILAISLDRHIAGWDFVMLTESLSISLLVIFIALFMWLMQGWHIGKIVLLLVTAFLLAFTRDTNAWLLLVLAGLILLTVILRWTNHRALILAIFFAFIFFISNASATLGGRWMFPLGNLIGQRILTNGSAIEFFQSCGMPVTPALLRLSGRFANADDRAIYDDPELETFRNWLAANGRSCYIQWLIAHPVYSIGEALNQFEGLITFSNVNRYFSRRYDPLMPVKLGNYFYPEHFTLWIWVYSTLAALIAVWKKLWHDNLLWLVFVCLDLLVFPHLFLTWHGDAMAPDRHALSVGVQLYLAFWILNVLLLDYFWKRKRNQGNPLKTSTDSKVRNEEPT